MAGEEFFPNNCVLGCTIESDVNYPEYSKAPSQQERLYWMRRLHEEARHHDLFVSIEPILDFNLDSFVKEIANIHPWAVAIGMDNYNNKLFEPTLKKTRKLIQELKGSSVYVSSPKLFSNGIFSVPIRALPTSFSLTSL